VEINLTSARFVQCVAVLLSILHAALAVTATIDKSPTFDEPTHLTAGYSYWLRNDFRMDSENGNLPARWAALPLVFSRPNFVAREDASWKDVSIGIASQQFFYRLGNNPEAMLLRGRIMMSILSAALCLLVFFCAQQLFGPVGGLIAEAFAVFDPSLLGHGALVASDVTVALFFPAAVWSTWRLLRCVSIRTLAFSAVSVSGLFLSKMSAPLFVIMAAVLALVHILSDEPVEIRLPGVQRILLKTRGKLVATFASLLVISAMTILAIWAAFGFRFNALTETGRARDVLNWRWNYLLAQQSPAEKFLGFARDHSLLPEAYLYGLTYIEKTSGSRPAFLDNHWSNIGFVSFFPRAFAYKTPLPMLCMLGLALFAVGLRWRRQGWRSIRRDCAKLAPIWTLLLVYGAFSLTAKLNIGHRYILPIYPPLFIACGGCVWLLRTNARRVVTPLLAILLCWQIAESFRARPNYLAYFNQIAGGPANGYKHLVDSSLDWGQDLPGLKSWLDAHVDQTRGEQVYLAYFGTADPDWYRIRASKLPEESVEPSPLQPGVYCISATKLQHVYETAEGKWARPYEENYQKALSWARDYGKIDNHSDEASAELERKRAQAFHQLRFARLCAYLRHREPLANVGYSILVFRLSAEDLHAALYGPPAELTPTVEVIAN
jgi:hypothetical protein